ncbi:Proton channel OTOP3 [Halotydeus destructor]|nr:Proton channel OTOP3 [Halotydeus destructor]
MSLESNSPIKQASALRRSSISVVSGTASSNVPSSSSNNNVQRSIQADIPFVASGPRTVSIADDVFAIDNIGYNDTESVTDFQLQPTRFPRKTSAPAYLEDMAYRPRRQSRPGALGPKRASLGLARYLSVQNNFSIPKPLSSPHKADSASVFSYTDTSDEGSNGSKRRFTLELITHLGSIIYAIFLVVMAAILYLTDMSKKTSGKHSLFNIGLATVGIAWLALLHIDIQKYKKKVIKEMFPNGEIPTTALYDVDADRLSTNTEVILNSMGRPELRKRSGSLGSIVSMLDVPSYRFLRGRHQGSFYLKCGMAAFCFGHIIHEGLRFGHQIYFFATGDQRCQSYVQIVLFMVRPVFSFYQLFITFKYSNIIINKWTNLAQFGVMHLLGTSLAFWLGTIIDDAVDYYLLFHKTDSGHDSNSTLHTIIDFIEDSTASASAVIECLQNSASFQSSQILPYMYPFTIEYNLCLAAIWFMVWLNIGKKSHDADPHPFQHTVHQDTEGNEEIRYESNLVIRADCHASNRGLFGGLSVMLFSLVTMIIFYIAVSAENTILAVYVQNTQEYVLVCFILMATVFAYVQTCAFDISPYHMTSHTMDVVLMLIPIPFYLLNNILSIVANYYHRCYSRIILMTLITIQVLLQTLFIADAMHRCSNSRKLRFKKPGREFVTFSIILNMTSWIVYTFETKAAEAYHYETPFYGEDTWMIISHTTLPLMLFYRFHASVCLADIWKFAYEKSHPD